MPRALSKKCHRPQGASQFPETFPQKSALHYILTHLSISPFHHLIFFLFSCQKLPRSIHSLVCRRNILQIIFFFKCVRLTKSGPIAIDLPRLREERRKAVREDDTQAESSINTIPGDQEMVSGFLPHCRGDLETPTLLQACLFPRMRLRHLEKKLWQMQRWVATRNSTWTSFWRYILKRGTIMLFG